MRARFSSRVPVVSMTKSATATFSASGFWARMRANELNWRKLGRNEKFAYRGLVACPPPDEIKTTFVDVPPLNEIDITVDATKAEQPLTAVIEPFVRLARPDAQ